VGKTRLALAVATIVQDTFADGAVFVDLSALRDPVLVAPTVAHALGIGETGAHGAGELLAALLQSKHLLLVLDNVEQVLEAAPIVATLVATCPRLVVLATSRAALRVRNEQQYRVPPLATPAAEVGGRADAADYGALRLFEARAQEVQLDFALAADNVAVVAQVCRRLDGLPLAIELAAARIALLPPPALLARLERRLALLRGGARDLPARQQTLRATIDWSHGLLTAEEKTLFRRLAVFAGGCTAETLASAEWNALGAPRDGAAALASPDTVLETLAALVDQSLIVVQTFADPRAASAGAEPGTRFGLLETIREYALEQLAASGEEAAVRLAHATHYLVLAEGAEVEIKGAQQALWLARLVAEHDNLRSALRWALESENVALALRLGSKLWRFWYMAGHLSEGRNWLDRILAQNAGLQPEHAAERAWVLRGASVLAVRQGDLARGGELAAESLAIQRAEGDETGVASALNTLGNVAREQGALDRAVELYEQSLALRRGQGDSRGMAVVLNNLGTMVRYQGDLERSALLHEESLALRRALGDTWGAANALHNLAQVSYEQGDPARALGLAEESLALRRDLGDKHGMALSLALIGATAQAHGDAAQAAARYMEGLTLSRLLDDGVLLATCLEGLAGVAVAHGQAEIAARLTEAAAALRGLPPPATREVAYEEAVAAVGAMVGHEGSLPPTARPGTAMTPWAGGNRVAGNRGPRMALLQDE
jgi:predicted ATPase